MLRLFLPILLMFLPRFLPPIVRHALLVWRLSFDRRVSLLLRLLVPLAMVYFLWPFDLVPDRIPVLGRLDDLIILGLAILLLVKLAPPWVVDEHLGRQPAPEGVEDQDPAKVVDGKVHFIDDDR